MLLERAEIDIRAGAEGAFLAAMDESGLPLLRAVPGVISARLGRGVENPSRFLFLVEWDRLESHDAFNADPVHDDFLALFAPHAVNGAMEHFQLP
jgi:heme-degrading monooxygenase HmoA